MFTILQKKKKDMGDIEEDKNNEVEDIKLCAYCDKEVSIYDKIPIDY